MKTAVIVFPGSNCDRDIAVALEARPAATVTARSRGATSGTSPLLPIWTLAFPTVAPDLNKGLAVQALKPHWISRVDSWTRPFQLSRPATTSIRRRPFCSAEPVKPYPASSVCPVFSPSAPATLPRIGLRLAWVMFSPEPIVLPQVKLGCE